MINGNMYNYGKIMEMHNLDLYTIHLHKNSITTVKFPLDLIWILQYI